MEEAQIVAVAGYELLGLSPDQRLAHSARLLLGSVQREAAGETTDRELLESAALHLKACERFFKKPNQDDWFRARYEVALATMQNGDLDEACKRMEAVLTEATEKHRHTWSANAHIGLSRIFRRLAKYEMAVASARSALNIARQEKLHDVVTRAGIALSAAQYEAATESSQPALSLLEELDIDIDRLLHALLKTDVRNRVMLLLLQTRVRQRLGQERLALQAYSEYRRIGHLVEVGRIRELATLVERELAPLLEQFRAPVDDEIPNFDMKANIIALRSHLVRMAESRFRTQDDQAEALGMSRSAYLDLRNKLNADVNYEE